MFTEKVVRLLLKRFYKKSLVRRGTGSYAHAFPSFDGYRIKHPTASCAIVKLSFERLFRHENVDTVFYMPPSGL